MRADGKLRLDVCSSRITPLIGVFDMFSASLVAQHYGGMFVSGFGFAASYYGLVDIDDGYVAPEVACYVVMVLQTRDELLVVARTDATEGAVDVAASIALLERNISRNHKTREAIIKV